MFPPFTSEVEAPWRAKCTALCFVFLELLLGNMLALHAGAQSVTRNVKADEQIASEAASNGRYFALVIGIDAYPKPVTPLKTAVHDAEDVARVLQERYGFQVHLLRNGEATRENILGAITSYEGSLGENDNLLIYYAGHGVKNVLANKSFWLPSDANSAQSSNRISADDLGTEMSNMRARHVLVISDSCYSGGLTRDVNDPMLSHGEDAFLSKMLIGRSRNLMASGRDEPVADGGPDGHSIFAYAVLMALEAEDQPIFTASDLFYGGVQRRVAGKSEQVPQYAPIRNSGDEAGDFVFKRVGLTRVEQEHRLAAPAAGYDRALALYGEKSFMEAAHLLTPLCESGNARGCNLLGVMYDKGEGVSVDLTQAVRLYRKGCDGADALACSNLGFMYDKGAGVASDPGQAFTLYRKACDGGNPRGCFNLGVLYEHGEGVSADFSQAVALYRKSCDGGEPLGCTNLGGMYRDGKGVVADPGQAVAFYRKGCDGGHANGCTNLGWMYGEGRGIAADPAQAVALYRKGCEGGNALGCTNLGVVYRDHIGVAADAGQAVTLFRRGCDGGNASGCTDLGSMYEHGTGVSSDPAQAVTLYGKACEGGEAFGCADLGLMYERGAGVTKDINRANSLYERSCAGGGPNGCLFIGINARDGLGMAKDRDKAATAFEKGCALGESHACENLKQLKQ